MVYTVEEVYYELRRHFSEDVVQETMCRMLALDEWPDDSLRYARRTAKRVAIDERRRAMGVSHREGSQPRVSVPLNETYMGASEPEQLRRLEAREALTMIGLVDPQLLSDAMGPPRRGRPRKMRNEEVAR